MTYAGRLDPMAEGVLLIIARGELKNFHDHLCYQKEYLAEIIFGLSSDTYDILGLPNYHNNQPNKKKIEEKLKSFRGVFNFKLPPFSGYKIKGKPLFRWALDGRIDEVDIPTKKVDLKKISISEIRDVNSRQVSSEIDQRLSTVVGNFRQDRIRREWAGLFKSIQDDFKIVKIKIKCGSGFYVRSLAHKAGKELSTGGLLFSLKRTKVGQWGLESTQSIFDRY